MLEYVATREGVQKCEDGWRSSPVTAKQQKLIDTLIRSIPSVKKYFEYEEYQNSQTRGNASELIAAVIESHPELLGEKTYLDYIATRPRAERIGGTHGLFSDEGKVLNLSDEVRKMEQFDGNIYSVIISIKRQDAERLGFNNAEKWRDMIRAQKDTLAKAHGIPVDKLCWYGAFHNEAHHPHVHLMLYSTDDIDHGYLTNKGIEAMRRTFGKEIFRSDLQEIYDKQTSHRNRLTSEAIDEFDALAESVKLGLCNNPTVVKKLTDLAEKLQTVKGKKVYGYLPSDAKRMVDELVDELEKDETVKRLYDLWYEAKCAVENTYTDHFSPQLPLSQENVFKPIRNAVVKRALELGKALAEDAPSSEDEQHESDESEGDSKSKSSSPRPSDSSSGSSPKPSTPSGRSGAKIVTAVTRLGKDISNTFRQQFYDYANDPVIAVDSRLRREIEAKKKGQNISM